MISSFTGHYRWLSNFHPCQVKWGLVFPSVEHAYQAAKCVRHEGRRKFLGKSAAQAKRIGRTVQQRPDWEMVKLRVMEYLLRQKFAAGTQLAACLVATDDQELIEGNTWGDRYWGVCNGQGQNHLGKLLMQIRRGLQKE